MKPSITPISRFGGGKVYFAPNEDVLLTKRKHWFVLVPPVIFTILFFIIASSVVLYLSAWVIGEITIFIAVSAFFVLIAVALITKIFMDWYFNIYIVTDRKIIELNFNPFFSQLINDVLLDQVRCTEIDIQTNGFINQLFNKGSVILTFDRPTHEGGFVLSDIKDPQEIGFFLEEILTERNNHDRQKFTWIKPKEKDGPLVFMEEILPREVSKG